MTSRFYRVAHFLLAWLARAVFLIIPKGRKNEPRRSEGPYLICANHISALDPVYICAAVRQQPHYMSKAELFRVPVLGWIIRKLGAYPVDRSGADAGALHKTLRMIQDGCSVAMFPQGTRRPGVDPAGTPLRNGVGLICDRSHVTVLPVYIKVKNNKTAFLRPVRVIIGRPVTYAEYTADGEFAGNYAHITSYLFDRVCGLNGRE